MNCALTVLRARSEQVDNVFVFSDHLHHLHLWHQVWQIFICGVVWDKKRTRPNDEAFWVSIRETWDQSEPDTLWCAQGEGMHVETIAVAVNGCALIPGARPQQSLTFEHFHSNSERLVGLLLVDADGLGHHHLTEAALAQRFTQSEPETKARPSQSFDFFCCHKQHWGVF